LALIIDTTKTNNLYYFVQMNISDLFLGWATEGPLGLLFF